MEARINDELDIGVELIEGEKGVFDVEAEGELVFSKNSAGRFPESQEIIDVLRARITAE